MSLDVVVLPPAPVLAIDTYRVPDPAAIALRSRIVAMLGSALAEKPDVSVLAGIREWRDLEPGPGQVPGWDLARGLLVAAGDHREPRLIRPPASTRLNGLLVVMADGSATVGPGSPRAGADGAPLDAMIDDALQGHWEPLAALSDSRALAVGCESAAVWRSLAAIAALGNWSVVDHHRESPFGVTYWIGRYRITIAT